MLDYVGRPSKPTRRPRKRATDRWLWAWVTVALAFAILAAALFVYASTTIMRGVQVLDVQLGGKTARRAAGDLGKNWEQRAILLQVEDTAIVVAPPDLGLKLDVGQTIRSVHQQGWALAHVGAWFRERRPLAVAPVLHFDSGAATDYLRTLKAQLDVPAVDATVTMAGRRAEVVPAVIGRELDVEATVSWLSQYAPEVVRSGRAAAVTIVVRPRVTDVSAVAERINGWLDHVLSVRAHDPIAGETLFWSAEPEVWSDWVSISIDSAQGDGWSWDLDRAQVVSFVRSQADALESDRYVNVEQATASIVHAFQESLWRGDVRVHHTGRQHTVRLGETIASIARDYGFPYPWIEQANPTVGDALRPGQVVSIPSPDVLLSLPVVEHKRIVVSISQQRMWAYENGDLVWAWPVSTGIESSPTSPGVFQILSHEPNAYAASWDLWMPHFMGIYRPVPTSGFMNGFHGFPTRDGANLLWTGSLGYPVTFGCILVSTTNAALLYDWAEEGTIVEVTP